jgi:hypothetical protein
MSMNKPAFARLVASLTALTLAAPALAQQNGSVSDFQLPSERTAPQQDRAQGPVVEGVPAPRVARPSPTPAREPVAVPPVVEVEVPESQTTPRDPFAAIDAMGQRRPLPTARPTAAAATSEAATATGDAAALPAGAAAQPSIDLPRSSAPQSAAAAPIGIPTPAGHIPWWVWLAAIVAVGVIGTAAGWFWRGRRTEVFLLPPPIERPKVPERTPERTGPPAELPRAPVRLDETPRVPQPLPVAAIEDEDEEVEENGLRIALEPARLSVSLLNATLSYRLLLTNQGDHALRDISIDGDMISAHASLSEAEQLAAPNSKLENRHLVRSLSPGETTVVSGDFALPLPMIRPIRKGDATLFVPLARLRIVSGGEDTQVLVQTSVVGQRSPRPGGGLRPFRLDLGPRIYSELGQRAFA